MSYTCILPKAAWSWENCYQIDGTAKKEFLCSLPRWGAEVENKLVICSKPKRKPDLTLQSSVQKHPFSSALTWIFMLTFVFGDVPQLLWIQRVNVPSVIVGNDSEKVFPSWEQACDGVLIAVDFSVAVWTVWQYWYHFSGYHNVSASSLLHPGCNSILVSQFLGTFSSQLRLVIDQRKSKNYFADLSIDFSCLEPSLWSFLGQNYFTSAPPFQSLCVFN